MSIVSWVINLNNCVLQEIPGELDKTQVLTRRKILKESLELPRKLLISYVSVDKCVDNNIS